jgi:DNA polymerase-3 subunit epsilon
MIKGKTKRFAFSNNVMIIYLDTETTSLRPGQICQLSYIIQERNNVKAKNFFFTVDQMEYSAFKVHGFSIEKLRVLSNGKRFIDHACEIEKDFNKADVIIAHNTSFDFMFLRAEFERLGKVFVINNEFCSMKKSTPILKLSRSKSVGYKYPKLSELCAYFDIKDWQIGGTAEKLFGFESAYHDARFHTTAVYLAVNEGIKCQKEFEHLKDFL